MDGSSGHQGRLAGGQAGWHPHLNHCFMSPFTASVQPSLSSCSEALAIHRALTACPRAAQHFTHIVSLNLRSQQKTGVEAAFQARKLRLGGERAERATSQVPQA